MNIKPERIFSKSLEEFDKLMMDLDEEIYEMHRECERFTFEMRKDAAYKYMLIIFDYLQGFRPENRSMKRMLSIIHNIVCTGEYEFLLVGCEERLVKHMKEAVGSYRKNKVEKLALSLAADYLFYYYNTFEKAGRSSSEAKEIKELYEKTVMDCIEEPSEEPPVQMSENNSVGVLGKNKNLISSCDRSFPVKLYDYLDQYVVGQEDMKKKLSMTVYKYLRGERSVFLLIGPSGSGKNYTMRKLKEFLESHTGENIVVYTHDVSSLTSSGFQGEDVAEIFKGYKKACGDKKNTKGIIALDEVDKIINPNTDSNGENTMAFVQQQLLSAMEGTSEIKGVDTKNILFILMGAFSKLYELEEANDKRKNVGFGLGFSEYDVLSDNEANVRENLIKIGGEREFIGRITAISRLDRLTKEELKRVLLHEKNGIIRKKKESFMKDGLVLIFEDSAIDMIVDKVYNENLGARSAINVVESLLGSYDFDMIKNGYESMYIHKGVVENGEMPDFYKKGENGYEKVSGFSKRN